MKCRNCNNFASKNKKSVSNHTRWCEGRMSKDSYKGINWGEKNVNWKGDDLTDLGAIHFRMSRRVEKPEKCVNCKKAKPYDLANISQKYKLEISDWKWICRRCHMTEDGRLDKFIQFRKDQLCAA